MKFRVLVIIICACISTQVVKSQLYYPMISKDNKWGYIDEDGDLKIIPKFDKARFFHENMAAVMINNKWGYIDTNGNIVIEPAFEKAYSFNEGIALVKLDSLYGYINSEGKFLISPEYIDGFSFNENRALVKLRFLNWVIIDTNNTIIANEIFYNENEGINPDYYFNSGVLVIPKSDYDTEIIQIVNKKGKNRRIPKLHLSNHGYSDSLILFKKRELFGYLNLKYKKIIKEEYNFATDFLDGKAWVVISDSVKYNIKMIDKSNNVLFEYLLNSDSISIIGIINMGNNMCLIPYSIHGNDKFLILNNSGQVISFSASELVLTLYEYKYPYYKRLQGNLILVKQNNQYKYIDMQGKTIWPN